MSTFKRNSGSNGGSKFGNGGGGRSSNNGPRANSGGNKNSGGGSNEKFAFQTIGSVTTPKSMDDDLRQTILDDIRGSDIKFTIKVYPPKGVDQIVLKRDDLLLLTCKVTDKDPDWVVGKLMISNE